MSEEDKALYQELIGRVVTCHLEEDARDFIMWFIEHKVDLERVLKARAT